MEPVNQPSQHPSFYSKVLYICTLVCILGENAFAQQASSSSGKITIGEILMYVGIIIVVIAGAWFFASRQSDSIEKEQHSHPHVPKKHYDHPNDPHFKKLKKKSS
jgi:hypothetical protein